MASRAASPGAAARLRVVSAAPSGSVRGAEPARSASRTVLLIVVPTAALLGIGLVMVFSASSVAAYAEYGSSFLFVRRQAIYAVVGIVGLLIASRVRYGIWQRLALPLLVATGVLLLLVLSVGRSIAGSARWISAGPVTIQPSEIAKLAVVVFGATVLARKGRRLRELRHVLLPMAPVVAAVCALIMKQPDLGTTLIIAGTTFTLLFAAGADLRHLAAGAAGCAAMGAVLVMSAAYRRARFLSFLSPWKDPQNAGYHLIQSYIALGSGGMFGVGLGASRQKWMYVPNAHTDFIFSILGEELGLVVAVAVVALFGVLVYAGIRVAARAPDAFGRLLAAGITSWLALQTIVNLGAVTGLLPITGVPLPLLSYGGSSLVVTLVAIGILLNVARAGGEARTAGGTPRRRVR